MQCYILMFLTCIAVLCLCALTTLSTKFPACLRNLRKKCHCFCMYALYFCLHGMGICAGFATWSLQLCITEKYVLLELVCCYIPTRVFVRQLLLLLCFPLCLLPWFRYLCFLHLKAADSIQAVVVTFRYWQSASTLMYLIQVFVKGPLTRPSCKFWLYTWSCKMLSRDCFIKTILQIDVLLVKIGGIECPIVVQPGGKRNC